MIKISILLIVCVVLAWASEVNTPPILKRNGRYLIREDLAFVVLVIVLACFTGLRREYNDIRA